MVRCSWFGVNPVSVKVALSRKFEIAVRDSISGADIRFVGPRILGLRALITSDASVRREALSHGGSVIKEGCAAHNVLWFHRDAIEACINDGNWDQAEHYASALEEFVVTEPLPWSSFYIAWGRALAAAGRDRANDANLVRIRELEKAAAGINFALAAPALERACAPV